MSKQIEHVQFVSTLSKGRNVTIESFDIVAGVDGALHVTLQCGLYCISFVLHETKTVNFTDTLP